MREDHQSAEENASANQARLAAQSAVSSVHRQMEMEDKGRVSKLALYTWGSLAVFCTFFAATSLVMPLIGSSTGQLADKQAGGKAELVEVEKPEGSPDVAKLENGSEGSSIDPVVTGGLGKSDRPINTQPTSGSDSAQDGSDGKDVFGVKIGTSTSVPELVERYRSLSRRAPDLFTGKKGRVRMAEANGQLQAQLITGPFNSPESVALFCRSVRLKLTVDCEVAVFGGDSIK